MASFIISDYFDTIWTRDIPDIKSKAVFYKHKKTKAEVIVLENDDDNKLFGIAFTTLPKDSTGIAHILEHSVLNGSAKYPVKEPFVELIKTSLNTFLNAMTWPDKTVYPVASQNEEDLHNLMDVYLDAVFFPRISSDILKQEGWHYELKDKNDPIILKGVVFNEMKGANSNPDSLTEKYMGQALFPNTLYSEDSGGDPATIPNLTYEAFTAFHKRYYHPSNSKTLLYGKQDISRSLEHLNEYLEKFDYLEINENVALQEGFSKPVSVEKAYPIGSDEDTEKKSIIVTGWVLGSEISDTDRIGLEILNYILLDSEASPLKQALLESGLGEDLAGGGYDQEYRQPTFVTGLKGVRLEDASKVEALILDTLTTLANGINTDLITGAINRIDFARREGSSGRYPKNVMYLRKMLERWNYGSDPVVSLEFRSSIDAIKDAVNKGDLYFEELIKKYLLTNNHRAHVRMLPDTSFTKRLEDEEKARLATLRSTLSDTELEDLVKETQRLEAWQKSTDTEEDLQKLPVLKVSDIPKEVIKVPSKEVIHESITLLTHDVDTNGITYIDFGFDLFSIPEKLINYTKFFGSSLIKLGTTTKSFEEISIALDTLTGGLHPSIHVTDHVSNPSKSNGHLFFSLKTLSENTSKSIELLVEVLNNANFNQKERFKQLLLEEKAQLEPSIVSSGHSYSLNRSFSGQSKAQYLKELTTGLTYFLFLKDLIKRVDSEWDSVYTELVSLREHLLTKNNLFVNITAPQDQINSVVNDVKKFIAALPEGKKEANSIAFTKTILNEAYHIPSPINYVAQSFNLTDTGYKVTGASYAVSQLLYTTYLWNRVRVQGGAYGGMQRFDTRSGLFGFTSYRDPNIEATYKVYEEAGEFLQSTEFSPREIEGNILGSISNVDVYLTPSGKGWQAMDWYLAGVTDELRQERKNELLHANIQSFKDFGKALSSVPTHMKSHVVLGNKEKVEAAKESLGLNQKELF